MNARNLNDDGVVINDSTEMANKFNLHFSTIADKLRSVFPNIVPDLSKLQDFVNSKKSSDVHFTISAITDTQVLNALKIINQHKATGIDKISARLLKIAAPPIAPCISRLINYLISTGTFPQRWKKAKVTPLFKSGNPTGQFEQ